MPNPLELGGKHPVRKTKKQKQAFREDVRLFAQENGYAYAQEPCAFGGSNLILGSPEEAEYIIAAHYDTCARLPFPNLLTPYSLGLFLGYQLLLSGAIALLPVAAMTALILLGQPELGMLALYLLLLLEIWLMLAGPANPHNRNDNTSGVVTALEIARSFPENRRSKVCFVLFDQEELGLLGSAAYRKAHKAATNRQLVVNLDCVGDGDVLAFFPTKKLRKDAARLARVRSILGTVGSRVLYMKSRGFEIYPSDQKHFPYGLGIAALHRGKGTLYLSRIHTPRDTVLDETNVNILRSALTTLITCGAVSKKGNE